VHFINDLEKWTSTKLKFSPWCDFQIVKIRNGYIYCFMYGKNAHIAKEVGKIINLELIFTKIKYYLWLNYMSNWTFNQDV
jgi:hypothetical protein